MKHAMCVFLFSVLMVFIMTGCGEEEDPVKERIRALYGENHEVSGEYDEELSVKCNNGTFIGKKTEDVISFKGIPYAKQPVGNLRWKAPQAADDDTGVYEAYYYGKSPVQTEWPSETGSYYVQGEDCLNLNIWVNTKNSSDDKTVMVFFHGGAYGWGGTTDPLYDGHNLVEKFDDIILVTVEYRVGLLGFIDLSSVEGGEEYAESGNLGLLDQAEALRWVQKNIAGFGGDPDNVTIFGESAGGGTVSLLPLMEGTEGLFKRVIAQSGSIALTYAKEECQGLTQKLLKETGCKKMSELVALSQEEIIAVNQKLDDCNIFPERDGVVIPVDLYQAYADGATSGIDMMIGTNADEVRYWVNEMGYYATKRSGRLIYSVALPVMYENNLAKLSDKDKEYVDAFMKLQKDKKVWNITEFYNELLFRVPALKQAELHAENGGAAYVYYWAFPGEDEMIGACHAIELSSVFNNLEETIYTGDHVDEKLADTVQKMWVNFARTGNPGTETIQWDAYDTKTRKTMVLDSEIKMVSDLKKEQRELTEPLLKYGFNGNHSQLSLMVPSVFKLGTIVTGILIAITVIIAFFRGKNRNKKSS